MKRLLKSVSIWLLFAGNALAITGLVPVFLATALGSWAILSGHVRDVGLVLFKFLASGGLLAAAGFLLGAFGLAAGVAASAISDRRPRQRTKNDITDIVDRYPRRRR